MDQAVNQERYDRKNQKNKENIQCVLLHKNFGSNDFWNSKQSIVKRIFLKRLPPLFTTLHTFND